MIMKYYVNLHIYFDIFTKGRRYEIVSLYEKEQYYQCESKFKVWFRALTTQLIIINFCTHVVRYIEKEIDYLSS